MRQMAHKMYETASHGIHETKQKWTNYCQRLQADIVNEKIMIVLHRVTRKTGMERERASGRASDWKEVMNKRHFGFVCVFAFVRQWADLYIVRRVWVATLKNTHHSNWTKVFLSSQRFFVAFIFSFCSMYLASSCLVLTLYPSLPFRFDTTYSKCHLKVFQHSNY